MAREFITEVENTWCTGCGNFGIMNAMKKAVGILEDRDIPKSRIFMTAGIGCHAKIFDYMSLSGLYSIHGRAMATAEGMKLGNPGLRIVAFCGDGDALGEGIAHMMHAAKRNSDITVVMHDNGVYALTTGQRGPTSPRGFKGPSTPEGNNEDPWKPLVLMLEAGATFAARGYSGNVEQLAEIVAAAVEHQGFSFVQVLQPSVTFTNYFEEYNEIVTTLEEGPLEFDEALRLARQEEPLPAGVFYRKEKEPYEVSINRGRNPVEDRMRREKRMKAIGDTLGG
ncbi:MAG: 2-oxoacid:ferredoxin oxidoreductase subunit beta [Candidatus Eisenbacteria bacterium]|nr:2-oxoacid:ferredoxin oxidoreductase subunit beta [Candidatus Eisenbacteria bacterium]